MIPQELLPADGRFGCGPAKVRPEALRALSQRSDIMGTSHRQAPVRNLVQHVQEMLAELYRLPDGYQVVLGNGGATLFWDQAVFSLVRERSAHGVNGEFSSKFYDEAKGAPFLGEPFLERAEPGSVALPAAHEGADVYGWAQNETSTGAAAPVCRVAGAADDALMLIDATSAAGGMDADIAQTDVYYFSPQKNFSSDGGLWIAFCSPAALARTAEIAASGRWIPQALSLQMAASNSAKHQTLNTPAIATLLLLESQLEWLLGNGGMRFATQRTTASSAMLYAWAEQNELTTPYVTDPAFRSPVVATIDLDERVATDELQRVLRANGIVDIAPYRSLGRNQIRVGTFVSVEPDDVAQLIRCLDWVMERIAR